MRQQRNMVYWDVLASECDPLELNDGQLLALSHGDVFFQTKGQGPALILLHGFFFDHTLWQSNVDALALSHTVYAVDLWGSGRSCKHKITSYDAWVEQISELMHALSVRSAVLIGQSLGAGVAAAFAVKYPDRVNALVLVAAVGMLQPPSIQERFFRLPFVGELMLKLPGEFVRRKMLSEFLLFRRDLVTDEFFHSITWHHQLQGSVSCMLAVMRGGFVDRLSHVYQQLASMSLSVLIVWGDKDVSITVSKGQSLAELLPQCHFVVLPDAGHAPNIDQAELFNTEVNQFCERLHC